MKKTKNYFYGGRVSLYIKFSTLLSILFLSTSINTYAQVTIGKDTPPVSGALLQLKSKESTVNDASTAGQGLMMPRVNLEEWDQLFPMFDKVQGTDYYDENGNPYSKVEQDKLHTGLWVYNVDNCFFDNNKRGGAGLYVWDGVKWTPLTPKEGPNLAVDKMILEIPSGLDYRGTEISSILNLKWGPEGTTVIYTEGAGTFIVEPTSSMTLTGGSEALKFTATKMPMLVSYPWITRKTTAKFELDGKPYSCPGDIDEIIVEIDQTNYAILSYNNLLGEGGVQNNIDNASDLMILTNNDRGAEREFKVRANTSWKAAMTTYPNLITSGIPTSGISNYTDNTPFSIRISNETNTKYQVGNIKIEDTGAEKRAFDVNVTVRSCIGEDPEILKARASSSTKIHTAGWAESVSPSWRGLWEDKVVLHQPKYGRPVSAYNPKGVIYDEFLSADFGDAGRWMITNLSAFYFDTGSERSQGELNDKPYIDKGGPSNTLHWAYAQANGDHNNSNLNPSAEYIANPYLGLLYTWAAATSGKGGPTGQDYMAEEGNMSGQLHRQGICPDGWHLPSDYEWTQLENEIRKKTSNYSSTPDLDNLPFDGNSNERSQLAPPLIDMCESGYSYKGTSNGLSDGGFSVLFAGRGAMDGGSGIHTGFGIYARIWTSSSSSTKANFPTTGNIATAYFRYIPAGGNSASTTSGRDIVTRNTLNSVRCKKND